MSREEMLAKILAQVEKMNREQLLKLHLMLDELEKERNKAPEEE